MNLHDIPVDRLVLRRIARRDFRRARLAAEAEERRLDGRTLLARLLNAPIYDLRNNR